jgi:ribose 5-phosphate isomerase B
MRIAVGTDHAGFEGDPQYKLAMVEHLRAQGHEVVDCGSFDAAAVDYPDVAQRVCAAIQGGEAECGVLLCGTGIGMSIAANRHAGIRAAVCATAEMVQLSRLHNNANVLCLGRRVLSLDACIEYLDLWLGTSFSGEERHARRVVKMQ